MGKFYSNRRGRLCQRQYLEVVIPGVILLIFLLHTFFALISPQQAANHPVFEIKARVDVGDLNHYFQGQHDINFNNGLTLYEYEM